MSNYGNSYLYEIRQRAVNVYQDILGQNFDDQYIGANHISYEECHKDKSLKIRALNKKQLRALGYFLYTFTPEKVINLIDGILKADKTIKALNEKIAALEKENDWLSDQLLACTDGKEHHLCQYECDLCGKICTREGWRNAAREAVENE